MNHEIKKMAIGDLKPREGNPNHLDGKNYAFLVKEIQKRGMVQPILVDNSYTIIDGEHRWRASRQLGLEEVDVVVIDVDELEAQAALINMNLIKGEFDPTKLGVMIEAMIDKKGRAELEKMVALEKSLISDLVKNAEDHQVKRGKVKVVDVFTAEKDPQEWYKFPTKEGDVWQVGNHRLICGDSSDPKVMERLLDGVDTSLCHTAFLDPPTNQGILYGKWKDDHEIEEYQDLCYKWIRNIGNYCNDMISIGSHQSIPYWLGAMTGSGFTYNVGNWLSPNGIANGGIFSKTGCTVPIIYAMREVPDDYIPRLDTNIIEVDPTDTFSEVGPHPLILPKSITVELLKTFTNRGDIVIDPFIGAGTTFIAAQMVRRSIYGVEIDPEYCNLALTRWSKSTGKIPEKL